MACCGRRLVTLIQPHRTHNKPYTLAESRKAATGTVRRFSARPDRSPGVLEHYRPQRQRQRKTDPGDNGQLPAGVAGRGGGGGCTFCVAATHRAELLPGIDTPRPCRPREAVANPATGLERNRQPAVQRHTPPTAAPPILI